MFFGNYVTKERIQGWFDNQLTAVMQCAPNGLDIEIKPHKKQRTNQQNRFFMAIMVALVRFYNETGFMPAGCTDWMMRTDILKEYFKARYGVKHTQKLPASEFGKLCDFVQNTLVQETNGEWEVLEPDSAYLKSLVEQGGLE